MKRKFLCFFLVFALMCAMSITAFALTAEEAGKTLGGSAGTMDCWAKLTVYKNRVVATTGNSEKNPGYCYTVATLYCSDSNGNEVPYTGQGPDSVTVYGNSEGIHGGSHHLVTGGTLYGAWSCTLRANVE